MRKIILSVMTLCFLNGSMVFAADSTGTPSGTAKQPNLDMKNADITNVDDLDADTATVSGAMKSGSVSTGAVLASSLTTTGSIATKNVSASGTVSANTVSAPSGAITNLNTNRTYVNRTPTSWQDATNKDYVDGKISALDSRVDTLESGNSSGDAVIVPTTKTRTRVASTGYYYNKYSCPSGYTAVPLNTGAKLASSGTYGGTNEHYELLGICIKSSAYVAIGTTTVFNRRVNGGGGN